MIATIQSDDQPIETARELESKRGALMTSGDADGLAEILSTDLYYAHSSGLLDDKNKASSLPKRSLCLSQGRSAR
jgi:hypothetical protein